MNDIDRLAFHRAIESEGSRTPQQVRGTPSTDERPRPWEIHRSFTNGWVVRDAEGAVIAQHLSARDAKIIAAAPELATAAQQYCDDFDRALTRVGL